MTTVGIIGVGYLGACLAEGLAKAGVSLVLSPRNPERVAGLAAHYGCTVADGNAEVVEKSDVILLATRPGDIAETADGLPWRVGQRVVSVAAGIALSSFAGVVAPAEPFRAMPIAASRIQSSPTAFCPGDPLVSEVFDRIGSAHPLEDETQFETASTFGAFYALVYAFLDQASGWAEANGLDPVTARNLTARMTQAASLAVIDGSARPPGALLDDLLTPGGITEAGLAVLEDSGALMQWSKALDASLRRAHAINAGG